jgi:subtilisin family serine protease
MTTDDTSSAPEPVRPQAAIRPEDDYPDPRTDAQRQDDEEIAAEQSAALTDTGADPHCRITEIIEDIQAERLATLALQLDDPPIQFDVFRRPDRPGQADLGDVILVARREMLLRVPAGGPPGREPGAAAADEETAWQRADRLLRGLEYTQASEDFPDVLPLRRYVAAEGGVEKLVRDRNRIRAAVPGAEVDLNYVVTAGHLVKADDYPRGAEAAHRGRRYPVSREVTVAVIDTGINRHDRTDGWLAGIPETPGNVDPLDVFPVTVRNGQITRGDKLLDLSAGHGTFVAGVVEQVAPAATIAVYRSVDTQGAGTSHHVARAIILAARDGADIINASLGTMTVDNLPPLAFTTALDIVQAEHPDVLIVASAGNMGQETPMFPAAMKGVVGVGALSAKLTPAPWSNHGFWVNCSAVGIGIISTFVEGLEPHTDAHRNVVTEQFPPDAWAIWSGTSFSAPQIAGKVAQLCQMNNVQPAVALTQLLAGKPIRPGYGSVIRILPGTLTRRRP